MERVDLKNLILVGVLGVVVAFFAYNGLTAFNYPGVAGWQAESAKLQLERNKLKANVESAQLMVANLDKIKKDREVLEAQLKEISKRLPGERESAEILRSVESLAGKAGLTLAGVKRRPVRSQELYAELPMEVGVGGGYLDVVKFADQLSKLDRLVTLNEFNVQRPLLQPGRQAAATDTAGTVRAQLVTVVFQALPEATSPPGAPGAPATPSR
ncbi:MAG: type 4a pilus biogenesis protein PilO [Candidatus Rokuibacteriota bacterium]